MNEQDFELEQEAVEVEKETETTPTKSTTKKPDTQGFIERGATERVKQAESMASVLGSFDHETARQALDTESSDITTMSAIEHNFDSAIRMDDAGDLILPEVPNVQNFLSQANEPTRRLYEQSRKSNVAQLELITEKYKKTARRRDMSVGERITRDTLYTASAGLAGVTDIATSGLALVGMGAGMLTQGIGTLGDEDNDNVLIDFGVLLQDVSVRYLNKYNELIEKGLSEFDAGEIGESAGEVARVALPVGLSAISAWLTGGATSASVVATASSKGVSKAVANRAAKMYARRAAGRIGKATGIAYAASATQSYLGREAEGKSSQEYQDYLRTKTGGQILSDAAWAGVVGTANYYLEKAFGSTAAISSFFGNATKGIAKSIIKSGAGEAITEVAQDTTLDISDVIRGAMGNEERGITANELLDRLISKDTLKTFVISSVIGGFTGGAEYASARANLVKEYKANLKKALPNITEKQLETAGKAFMNSVDENVSGKVKQSLVADDQLKNGYGTYHKIVENRINNLVNQSIAQGKELAFKDKSPEYQAQFVGSTAQRFVDELYAQAVLRGVPVNEVFNVTKMDVEKGVLYMYGKEYGKRPLTQFTKDMTPAQWEEAQIAKRAADALQEKEKAQKEEIKKQVEIARKKEKEEERKAKEAKKLAEKAEKDEAKRQASREKSLPYREYLASQNFTESELTDTQAIQQARTMAHNEIRRMPEDNARGVLATLRDDLPVESMTATEIRQILRSELERFMALQDKESIAPIAKMPSTKARQEQIVRRVRMAKPKSFSEYVRSAGISKDTVQKLGLEGELKKILDKNYRFFVRKNGTISNFEELAMEYKYNDMYDPNNPQQATVNDFLELLERDLQTKDIYSYQDENALKEWQERSIRAGKEEESRLLAERDQELADSIGRLQEAGYDTSTMTDDAILAKGREMRAEETARMDMIDSDIDFDAIPDDDWLHSIKEQTDLADENARLDEVNPEYTGETIDIFDYDTTSVSDWADKNIEKQDSFETDEGVFTNYKLVGDNRNMPTFTVFESKDGWIVRNAYIPESEQNKGIGTKFYQYINLKSIEKTDKPLRSTQPRKLSSGKEVFELSDLGHKLWNSLTKKGLAVKNKNGTYEFKKPQERTVYNSNGERIAKSEPALRNFWNWFGDSKAVDEGGRPLVVYHGTNEEFDEFDIRYFGRHDNGWLGVGFYTTNDEEMAESYGSIVMPLYTKLENPYILTASDASYNPDHLRNKLGVRTGMEINEHLRNNGYDGVLLSYTDDWGFAFREAMALERNQIKSTQNRGTFSSDTGNIYYQTAYAGSRVDYDKPSLEALGTGEGAQAHGWGLYYALNKDIAESYRQKFVGEGYDVFVGGKPLTAIMQVSENLVYEAGNSGDITKLKNYIKETTEQYLSGNKYIKNIISQGESLISLIENNPKMSISKFDAYVKETYPDDYYRWQGLIKYAKWDAVRANRKTTIKDIQRRIESHISPFVREETEHKKAAEEVLQLAGTDFNNIEVRKSTGQVHEVDIPEMDVLLDEQNMLIDQSEFVQSKIWEINEELNLGIKDSGIRGGEIYQRIADSMDKFILDEEGNVVDYNDPYKQASQYLDRKGIKGITYDGRRDGRCFVIFNENSVKVLRKKFDELGNMLFQGRKTQMGQRNLAAWNPLRRSIELFTGANETSIMHELSHFWLDNMMLYSRLESAARDSGFAKVWNNIKKYLNIDDRQERINESQAEKYTSAYMQYIRNTKIAPVVDLGFKGMDEFIGDISLDYFENAKHREADGTITSELEIITPEMVDTFQKLTTTDLNAVRDLVVSLQDREFTDGAIDSQLGEESTPEQMKTAVAKQERETRQKIAEKSTQNAERDSMPADIPQDSKTMQNAQNRLDKEKSTYEVGTTDEESFAKAREIIAKDRARAEEIVAIDPNGITDGIANSFIALELARQAVANGKNAMPYLESFVNGASASGANLRTANLLNTPEFAWAKDMYEASKAKNYAVALRMRPAARNAIMHRSRIAQTFESKLDQYVEELYPQLLQAQTYEEQVKIINEWANNTAKKIGVEPTSEVWGQTVKGTSAKKTEFSKEVVYQKRKLKEFLKSKIGATLTDAEQLKIRQLHTNTIDAMRQLQTNPNDIETAKEFIRKAREYQDYLNALAPVNWANALFSSIPRASMLFRISTQVKNTVGTRLEILLSDLNRQLRYGKDNLISKKDRDAEIKKSVEMFLIGGFSPDVQENFFETPILAWGEKQYSMIQRGGERRGAVFSIQRFAQDTKDIVNYIGDNWKSGDGAGKKALVAGRIGIAVAEKMTGKAYDVLAYSDAYMKAIIATHETAKASTFYAQTIGKEKGWTKEQIKEYAEMLFKDARSYIPKTKLGVAIRKQAVEQAKIETFIKNGTIAEFANRVRAGINLGKESGIGTFISPYVSTAANIMQLGIDYTTGWWRRFDGWKDVKKRIYENAKKGEPIDQKDMEYLEKGYRGTYGGAFLLTMLALFKGAQALTGEDDTLDYVPPYSQLTPRERAYYKQVNGGKYNAVKIVDVWVSAEYFGGLSNAITNLGTWYHANSIISAAKGMIAETPVIGDLVEQHDKLQQDITYDKGVIDIAMASVLNQAEKYIPGIGKDIYKTIDEGRILYPFFGSSVGLTVSDEAKTVLDVQRESKATYTSISRSKPFNTLSKEDKRKLDDEFNKEYIDEANKWIQRNPNATPEQQKKALDAIRKKIREKLKRKYKVK